MADDHQGNPNGQGPKATNRLPPPAFPPGQRLHTRQNPRAPATDPSDQGQVPDDAFISPDEPIVRTGSRIADGAFISPDAPLPRRDTHEDDTGDGVVTGIGDDEHLGREDLALSQGGDPLVAELATRIGRLAEGLRDKGESALRTHPDMTRFEATLRAYCVGYLAAQREVDSD